ncbi:MAG: virginiamycin B lyase family protein [Acidimicrobiales bacterium]
MPDTPTAERRDPRVLVAAVSATVLLVAGVVAAVRLSTDRHGDGGGDQRVVAGDGAKVAEVPALSAPVGPVSGPATDPCGSTPMMTLYSLSVDGGRPTGVAAGENGSVWFTDPGSSSIGHLEANGRLTRFALAPANRPGAIVRAQNGDLWFTDPGSLFIGPPGSSSGPPTAAIGRITPAGVISSFPLPTQTPNPRFGASEMGSYPHGITAGPDGAMWFTESAADQIGRITPDGTITEFALPSRSSMHANPTGIVTGPDGAIWFTQPLRDGLGRFDPVTQSFVELSFPPPRHNLVRGNSLTSGPGELMWFEDPASNSVGRMTPAGRVNSVAFPSGADPLPVSLAPGPDGNVWFVDQRNTRIMRLAASGAVTTFPPVEGLYGVSSTQLAVGTDQAIWFAVPEANRLGRIACSGP